MMKQWIIVFGVMIHQLQACYENSTEIGVCLHTYLERDFGSISMFANNHGDDNSSPSNNNSTKPKRKEKKLLVEGPDMENDCKNVGHVITCFEEVLKRCYYMEDFFQYRDLLVSLEKTLQWTCDVNQLHHRFKVLLLNLHCINRAWSRQSICFNERISENVWNRIIRMEEPLSICPALYTQGACIKKNRSVQTYCRNAKAQKVYEEMSDVFLTRWCSTATLTLLNFTLLVLSIGVQYLV